jgi:hypothetical protein
VSFDNFQNFVWIFFLKFSSLLLSFHLLKNEMKLQCQKGFRRHFKKKKNLERVQAHNFNFNGKSSFISESSASDYTSGKTLIIENIQKLLFLDFKIIPTNWKDKTKTRSPQFNGHSSSNKYLFIPFNNIPLLIKKIIWIRYIFLMVFQATCK